VRQLPWNETVRAALPWLTTLNTKLRSVCVCLRKVRAGLRPRSNPAAAGTVPRGQVRRACFCPGGIRTLSGRAIGLSLRCGSPPRKTRVLRHASSTTTRLAGFPTGLTKRNVKERTLRARVLSVVTPATGL
jgi:hypothetical protein